MLYINAALLAKQIFNDHLDLSFPPPLCKKWLFEKFFYLIHFDLEHLHIIEIRDIIKIRLISKGV